MRTLFIVGLVLVINALIHFLIVQKYGIDFIEAIKQYDSTDLYKLSIKLVKYEMLIGFLVLTLSSGFLLNKKQKEDCKR